MEICGLALHPTLGWVACATVGAKVHFLSGDTLQPVRPPLTSAGDGTIQITPDGASLAWCAANVIHLLNLRTHAELRQLLPPEGGGLQEGSIDGLGLSPGGTLLASSAGGTKHVQLWELWSGRRLADLYVGGGTVKVAFAPDGRSLAVTADERTLLYEVRGQHEQTVAAMLPEPILGFALHRDGRRLACVSSSVWDINDRHRDVTVWPLDGDAATPPSALRVWRGNDTRVTCRLAFHPHSTVLAYTGAGAVAFWDPTGQPELRELPADVREAALCFGPDGRLWGAAGRDVFAWDPRECRALARWFDPLKGGAHLLASMYAVAAGGERVVAGERNGQVHLLRAADATWLAAASAGDSPVRSVALSSDETLAAAGTDKGELSLLRVAGAEVLARAVPHGDRIEALSWSGSRLLASGSRDHTVKLWRVEDASLQELLTVRTPAAVRWLEFHPDGVRLLVLLDRERAVRVWHLDRLRDRLADIGLAAGLEVIEPVPLPPAVTEPSPAPPAEEPAPGPNGLRVEVFDDMQLRHCVKVHVDREVNFHWDGPSGPDPLQRNEYYSLRWSGWLKPPRAGRYTLALESDDGARLWLDGKLLIADWRMGPVAQRAVVDLSDQPHALRIEYYQVWQGAHVSFHWAQEGGFSERPVPASALFHDRAAAEKAIVPAP